MSLKLVRRHGSPNWHIRGSIGGCRIEESTYVSDKRVAEEIRAKREAEVHRGQKRGAASARCRWWQGRRASRGASGGWS